MKRSRYSGIKKVEKWIEENVFPIHEFSRSNNHSIYETLNESLSKVLKPCTKNIKIQHTTKLKDVVMIDYNTEGKYKMKYFKLLIYPELSKQ
jgi:hypothetical protein